MNGGGAGDAQEPQDVVPRVCTPLRAEPSVARGHGWEGRAAWASPAAGGATARGASGSHSPVLLRGGHTSSGACGLLPPGLCIGHSPGIPTPHVTCSPFGCLSWVCGSWAQCSECRVSFWGVCPHSTGRGGEGWSPLQVTGLRHRGHQGQVSPPGWRGRGGECSPFDPPVACIHWLSPAPQAGSSALSRCPRGRPQAQGPRVSQDTVFPGRRWPRPASGETTGTCRPTWACESSPPPCAPTRPGAPCRAGPHGPAPVCSCRGRGACRARSGDTARPRCHEAGQCDPQAGTPRASSGTSASGLAPPSRAVRCCVSAGRALSKGQAGGAGGEVRTARGGGRWHSANWSTEAPLAGRALRAGARAGVAGASGPRRGGSPGGGGGRAAQSCHRGPAGTATWSPGD